MIRCSADTCIWLIFIVHVGKHTSHMDLVGVPKLSPVAVGRWVLECLVWRCHIGVLQRSQ